MRVARAALATLTIVSLAAFGGSVSPLLRAVEASPYTYYHFRDAVWWGRPVTLQTLVLHSSADLADVQILARAGGKTVGRERLSFARTNGRWAARVPLIDPDFGAVLGPVSTRKPTATEQAQVSAAGFRELKGESDCVRFTVAISKVDPRYASASLEFYGPRKAQCESNGVLVLTRAGSGLWRYLGAGSDPFPCTAAPAGVIRSLFGECLIQAPR